jgi:hypothetical protein
VAHGVGEGGVRYAGRHRRGSIRSLCLAHPGVASNERPVKGALMKIKYAGRRGAAAAQQKSGYEREREPGRSFVEQLRRLVLRMSYTLSPEAGQGRAIPLL